ncbi:hypothetical protein Ciccas_013079 [Cichlidogyrus casuarinus]|uniref:Band 7 domain-containing protein n=1 Tax=Cichlidogyrus casuarinus TaxID=1844966 RepID=A0ABD2PRM1_9PLAT
MEEVESNSRSRSTNRIVPQEDINKGGSSSYGCCGWAVIILSGVVLCLIFPIAICFSFKTIQEYERGVVLRLGKCVRSKGRSVILQPGLRFLLPCTDKLLKISLRTQSFNIPPQVRLSYRLILQEVLTKDAVTCNVDAIVYLHVVDPAKALLNVENVINSSQFVAVSALRTIIGQFELSELMQEREVVDNKLREVVDKATDPWGVVIERVDIKDVSLPADMQRAMAAEAQAVRQAKAKVILAQGELDSSNALVQASQSYDKSPAALHLRYLQTLNNIAAEQNSTVIFPLPMELMKIFSK